MRPEARVLGQELLNLHKARTAAHPPGKRLALQRYTISYSDLCASAGVPHITRIVGGFLGEIAEWCATNNFPPLNALAVNSQSGQPGEGFDGAGGFKAIDWPKHVEECVRFTSYPAKMP